MTVSADGAFHGQRGALDNEAILPYWRDLLAFGDVSGIATSMPRFTVHGPTLVKKPSYKVGLAKSAGKDWVQPAEIRTALDGLFPAQADPASGAASGTLQAGSVVEPDALRPTQQNATRDVENDCVSVVVAFHDPGAFGRDAPDGSRKTSYSNRVETGKLEDGAKPPFPLKPFFWFRAILDAEGVLHGPDEWTEPSLTREYLAPQPLLDVDRMPELLGDYEAWLGALRAFQASSPFGTSVNTPGPVSPHSRRRAAASRGRFRGPPRHSWFPPRPERRRSMSGTSTTHLFRTDALPC